MNPYGRIFGRILPATIILFGIDGADAQTCVSNQNGPTICAKRFSLSGVPQPDPLHNFDFRVTYAEPTNPDVELLIGNVRFQLWSIYGPPPNGTSLGNIGDITVSQTTGYDYQLVIKNGNGTSAGAFNVQSIALTPPGDRTTGIVSDSFIFNSVTGPITLESPTGTYDAACTLFIGENLEGPLHVPGGDNFGFLEIVIGNDITSTGSITVNDLWENNYIHVVGDAHGPIVVGGTMLGSGGNVAYVTVDGDFVGASNKISVKEFLNNAKIEVLGDCYGSVEINENNGFGVTSADSTNITIGKLKNTGRLDFNGDQGDHDMNGDITLVHGAESGAVISGITKLGYKSHVILGTSTSDEFKGAMTVEYTEQILLNAFVEVQKLLSPGSITISNSHRGSIQVNPDVAETTGSINVGGISYGRIELQKLVSPGFISIGDDLTGSVEILGAGTSTGVVAVGDDLTGTIYFAASMNGNVAIGNTSSDGIIGATGVIEIGGTFGGYLCADNLIPGDPFPGTVDVGTFDEGSTLCGVDTCDGGVSACDYFNYSDLEWCSLDQCQNRACINECENERTYGDVNLNNVVTLDDILATIAAFYGTYTNCGHGVMSGCDVWNVTAQACSPQDGRIDLDDILKVNSAFGGNYSGCTSPCDCGGDSMMGGSYSSADGPVDAASQIIDYLATATGDDDLGESGLWTLGEVLAIYCQTELDDDQRAEVVAILEQVMNSSDSAMNTEILVNLLETLK